MAGRLPSTGPTDRPACPSYRSACRRTDRCLLNTRARSEPSPTVALTGRDGVVVVHVRNGGSPEEPTEIRRSVKAASVQVGAVPAGHPRTIGPV